jgi:pectinesterase/polygalacturonase
MLTAQSKATPGQDSGYVFDHCRVTAAPGAAHIWLGRPWRPYATVVFLDTHLDAPIAPGGWREWHEGETHALETATYAERGSTGLGADPTGREPHSRQLSASEARAWSFAAFMTGRDHWEPSVR